MANHRSNAREEESMESGGQEGRQAADFLTASSYGEQEGRKSSDVEEGRDEGMQAGDFLRGSRGDEPGSALLSGPHRRDGDDEKVSSATQTSSEVTAETEKPVDDVEMAKEPAWQLGGGGGESVTAETEKPVDDVEIAKEPAWQLGGGGGESVTAETEKAVDDVEIAKEPAWQLGGGGGEFGDLDAATTHADEGEEKETSSRGLPHHEVPQPGQFTDMDAVAEFVALGE